MFKLIKKSALIATAAIAIAFSSFGTTANTEWNKVNEMVPFKSAPAQAYSAIDLENAIGRPAGDQVQLQWATHALNKFGVARLRTASNTVSTVWHANNPTRGPYKGHTGLVLKECDRAAKPTCFSRAI